MKLRIYLIIITFACATELNAQKWQQVWSDEFNYTGMPDGTKWTFEDWAPKTSNGELQRYVPNRSENCRVENGNLIIEARKDSYLGDEYSSARIHSSKKAFWTYGRIEARMKLPGGKGTWSAFWMMPENLEKYGWNKKVNYWWPNCGEIDIAEYVGYDFGNIVGSLHSNLYNFKDGTQLTKSTYISDAESSFHVYAIEWFADRIDFYVDSLKYSTIVNDGTGWVAYPFDHDFHIIFNLAVGGLWGAAQGVDPNIWPKRLEVDYVRVYKDTCKPLTIPAKIEAENYSNMRGVQTEDCKEGGKDVSSSDSGNWFNFLITVPKEGTYKISYRVASSTGGKLKLDKGAGAKLLRNFDIPNTGGTQNWSTISDTITLLAGTYYIGLLAEKGGFNINWIDFSWSDSQSIPPFYQKIEAESFSSMNNVKIDTCSEGGKSAMCKDTNWMKYNVNLPKTGNYILTYRVASNNSNGKIILSKNDNDIAFTDVPNTGDLQKWISISQNIYINSGEQELVIYIKTGDFNLNWWSLEYGTPLSAVSGSLKTDKYNVVLMIQNPVKDLLRVLLPNDYTNAKISVLDLRGRIVFKMASNGQKNLEFNARHMKSGSYIMKVSNGHKSQMVKFVKK